MSRGSDATDQLIETDPIVPGCAPVAPVNDAAPLDCGSNRKKSPVSGRLEAGAKCRIGMRDYGSHQAGCSCAATFGALVISTPEVPRASSAAFP